MDTTGYQNIILQQNYWIQHADSIAKPVLQARVLLYWLHHCTLNTYVCMLEYMP